MPGKRVIGDYRHSTMSRSTANARPMSDHGPVVYVLGQDEILRRRLCAVLKSLPWPVQGLGSHLQLPARLGAACVVAVQERELDLLVLLERLRGHQDRVRLILLTDSIDVANAVDAMRQGVDDLIEMPVVERELHRRVRRAMLSIDSIKES